MHFDLTNSIVRFSRHKSHRILCRQLSRILALYQLLSAHDRLLNCNITWLCWLLLEHCVQTVFFLQKWRPNTLNQTQSPQSSITKFLRIVTLKVWLFICKSRFVWTWIWSIRYNAIDDVTANDASHRCELQSDVKSNNSFDVELMQPNGYWSLKWSCYGCCCLI